MHATAKVSPHIHDISPSLNLRRDKVYTTYPTQRRRHHIAPPMEVIEEIDQNYTWKKLPNISAYKNAIVRNKVCEGIMYLLPSNKNGTSLARPYTAELGAMFNEPYHSFKPDEYNEETVMQSSKVHFSPNTHATRLTQLDQVRRTPADLNSDSRSSYDTYSTLLSKPRRWREEGRGNLPIQLRVGQAEQDLQHEVNKILADAGVNEIKTERHEPANQVDHYTETPTVAPNNKLVRFQDQNQTASSTECTSIKRVREFKGKTYERKSAMFTDYKQLRTAAVPEPQLPKEMKSEYLNEQKSQEIWKWLNWDFKKTQFEHFLDVCS